MLGFAKRILDKKLDLFLKVVFPKNNKKRRISGWKIITIIMTPTLINWFSKLDISCISRALTVHQMTNRRRMPRNRP